MCAEGAQVAINTANKVGSNAVGSPDDDKFTDSEFPPESSSLMVGDGTDTYVDLFPEEIEMLRNTDFMRVTDYYSNRALDIFNDIGPNDIKQGQLGNCYFLSGISAVAEFPSRIEACIPNQNFNYAGKYMVRMFVDGKRVEIVVDDYFATNKETGRWQFSYSTENEIWVQLLEKAWAKACGTFAKTIGGHTSESLKALTGGPCKTFQHNNISVDDLWNNVYSADQMKHVMCCSVSDEDYQGEHASKGLATNHAYTLIGAVDTCGVRLVQIRNPWGSYEWNGAWNDNDPNWTDEMREEAKWTNEDDGTFFMSVEDFKEEFGTTTICYAHEDYVFEWAELGQNSDGNTTTFTLEEDAKVYVNLTQKAPRSVSKSYGYMPKSARLLVAQQHEDDSLQMVDYHYDCWNADTFLTLDLPAGTYVIWSNIDWDSSMPIRSYSVSVYAPSSTNPQEIDLSNALDEILASADNGGHVRRQLRI